MQYTLFDLNSPNFNKLYLFKNKTTLGAIYQTIDWDSLIKLLPIKNTMNGSPSWLPAKGYFGLMFLKHYTKLSDEKLLERLNTDWGMQLFCVVQLADNEMIRDNAFVSNVRRYLGKHIDFEAFQKSMIANWKLEIPDKNVVMMDATFYEVHLRFPTDVKLLWESCEWLWDKHIPQICKENKHKIPRSKFEEQKVKHLIYSKLRKKSYRKTRSRKNALQKLLEKGINAYQVLLNQTKAIGLTEKDAATFKTIKLVLQQPKYHFENPKAKILHRIVSLRFGDPI